MILIYIIVLISLLSLGVYLAILGDKHNGEMVSYAAGVLILFPLLGLIAPPIIYLDNRVSTNKEIYKFMALKQTVEYAHKVGNDFENFSLTKEIITANKWLAKTKYMGTVPILNIGIPDRINTIKPIGE